MGDLTELWAIDWSHLTPVNILFGIVAVATMVGNILTFLQSKHNSAQLKEAKTVTVQNVAETKEAVAANTAITQVVAARVNGHLDKLIERNMTLEAQVKELIAENARLKSGAT